MKRGFIVAACAALCTTGAMANVWAVDEDVEAAAMAKCVADTSALGADAAEAGCACFVERLPESELAAYVEITDWDTQASDAMKEAGAACFPELQ